MMIAIWATWLIAVVASFAVLEAYAIKTRRLTLSATIWLATRHWPFLAWIGGALFGGLAVHFWWIPHVSAGF